MSDEQQLQLASFSVGELKAELDRRSKVQSNRGPAGRCDRCGTPFYFVGTWSPPKFTRQIEAFKAEHQNCPLSVDGGGI